MQFGATEIDEALTRFGAPEIFNTDQGAEFTDSDFIDRLKAHGIAISMDGKRRWIDNVFIERLWRTVKYEEVYLRAYDSLSQARGQLKVFLDRYNDFSAASSARQPHARHRVLRGTGAKPKKGCGRLSSQRRN